MILRGFQVLHRGAFRDLDVRVENGKIVEIGQAIAGADMVLGHGEYLIPGFVDIHTHGCVGEDFSTSDVEGIHRMSRFYLKNGVTSVMATVMTEPEQEYRQALVNLRTYIEGKDNGNIMGVRLEGPYISREKKGAHDERYLKLPDVEEIHRLDDLTGGNVRILDIAPELPGAMACIEAFSKEKIVSLAHTACDSTAANKAFDAGATQVTHLFNAMNSLHHREPGLIGAAYENRANVELICDGVHVNKTVLRMWFQLMKEKALIISDSMSACGLEDGSYTLGGQQVTVKNKRAVLADGTLAGAVNSMADNVRFLVEEAGLKLADVVMAASQYPAKAVGMGKRLGKIAKGYDADLVVMDCDLRILRVYKKGETVYDTDGSF